jgi:putative transposase
MKPSYISQKVTVIGTAVIQKVVQLMTINNSIATIAFKVFIEIFLWLELWPGAVVVMDNLPAHKLGSIQFLNNFSINFE